MSLEKNYGDILMVPIQLPTDATKLAQWKIKDTRVMSWLIGSCDPQTVLNLYPNNTAKDMWEYLKSCILKQIQLGDSN